MQQVEVFKVPFWEYYVENFDKELLFSIKNKSKSEILKDLKLLNYFNLFTNLSYQASYHLTFLDCNIRVSDIEINKSINSSNSTFLGIFCIQTNSNLDIFNPFIKNWNGYNLVQYRNQFSSQKLSIKLENQHIFIWPSFLEYELKQSKNDIILYFSINCKSKK